MKKKILFWQLIVYEPILLSVLSTESKYISDNKFWLLNAIISLLILNVILVLQLVKRKNIFVKQVESILCVICLPYIFLNNLGLFSNIIENTLNSFPLKVSIAVIYYLLYLIIILPVVYIFFGKISNFFLRFLAIIVVVESFYWAYPVQLNNSIVTAVSNSQIVNGFALFIFAYTVMKVWNLPFGFNLKFKINKNFQMWVLIFLIVFTSWYVLFLGFSYSANTASEAFWQFKFDTLNPLNSRTFKSTLELILSDLEAGIFEETFRYLVIVTCYGMVEKSKFRLVTTIVISAFLFSIMHWTNYTIGYQTLRETVQQLYYTFGMGCLFATVYLYTGKLWLIMIFHALTDFISFSYTPLSMGSLMFLVGYGPDPDVMLTIIQTIIPIAFTIFMLFGKRRRFMQDNAQRLITPLS